MSDTLHDLRLGYALSRDNRSTREDQRNTDLWEEIRDAAYADFDSRLAAHDAAIRAATMEEAAKIAEDVIERLIRADISVVTAAIRAAINPKESTDE